MSFCQQMLLVGRYEMDCNKIPIQSVDSALFGREFAIYSGNYHKDIYAIGGNKNGECAVGHDNEITESEQITYFMDNDINIKTICTNICSNTTFWISTTNNIYATGCNEYDQLGVGDYRDRVTPQLIFYLQHIVDVQTADDFSIALCDNTDQLLRVIAHWSGYHTLDEIPIDILNMILAISGIQFSKVYSTPFFCYHGNVSMKRKWKEIDVFATKNIRKIRVGSQHSLFLQSNGLIWSCGANKQGELGLGHNGYCNTPSIIESLVSCKIKIRMIECGSQHNLAISYKYQVYSWGNSNHGQCGHGTTQSVNTPQLIEDLKGFKIFAIGCGFCHSYCKTSDGEYFLFGSNKYNECLTYDQHKQIAAPFCVNNAFEEHNQKRKIKCITLGYYTTAVMTCPN
eukprot:201270_1